MKVDTGQPPPHKGCTSATCCSPARLWRTLQNLIKQNDQTALLKFFEDPRLEHIVRVALSQRVSNNAASLPPSQRHTLVRFENKQLEAKAHQLLGKSLTDLNSLQLALLTSSESTVMALLVQLRQHAKPAELKSFIHHLYGQGNTSLHLAVFLNRPRVVKVLIEMGASLDMLNTRKKSVIDCCQSQIIKNILLPPKKKPEPTNDDQQPLPAELKDSNQTMHAKEQEVQCALDPYMLFFRYLTQYLVQSTALQIFYLKPRICQQYFRLPQEKKPPDIALSLLNCS